SNFAARRAAPMDEQINTKPRRFGAQFLITVLLILIAAAAGAGTMYVLQVQKPKSEIKDANREVQLGILGADTISAKLADKFTDADDDMLPDPPKDPKQLIDPPTLVCCYIAQEEAENYHQLWQTFCDHLAKVTGKPVEYLEV